MPNLDWELGINTTHGGFSADLMFAAIYLPDVASGSRSEEALSADARLQKSSRFAAILVTATIIRNRK